MNELTQELSQLKSLQDQLKENYNNVKNEFNLSKLDQSSSLKHIKTLEKKKDEQKEEITKLNLQVNELKAFLQSEKENQNKLDDKIK